MTCIFCKGDMKESTTTYFVDLKDIMVIVKNVPCIKCEQCGEEVFTAEVTSRLEAIIDKCKETLTEIAIVNYTAA